MRAAPAWIGIGSNLGVPAEHVAHAFEALDAAAGCTLRRASSLYANPAVGPGVQPDYVNAVAAIDTTLEPLALLEVLQAIEARRGRRRGPERWAPRTLDLDLLVYADRVIEHPRLVVPHPRIAERAFVLRPLAEISTELVVPGLGPLEQLCKVAPDTPMTILGRGSDHAGS